MPTTMPVTEQPKTQTFDPARAGAFLLGAAAMLAIALTWAG